MSAPFIITVTDHAYWRAAERFPGFHTERIEEEILVAFKEKRISTTSPEGINNGGYSGDSLYVWTPDGKRVYVLRCSADDVRAFAVITVMDRRDG